MQLFLWDNFRDNIFRFGTLFCQFCPKCLCFFCLGRGVFLSQFWAFSTYPYYVQYTSTSCTTYLIPGIGVGRKRPKFRQENASPEAKNIGFLDKNCQKSVPKRKRLSRKLSQRRKKSLYEKCTETFQIMSHILSQK